MIEVVSDPGAYYLIRSKIIEGINRFALLHEKKGQFIMAVLSNDLRESIARADDFNRPLMLQIVSYCHNEIPSICWGSPEKVKDWLEMPKEKWPKGIVAPESSKELARQIGAEIWCISHWKGREYGGDRNDETIG